MERRILAWVLSGAHFVLVTLVVAVAGLVGYSVYTWLSVLGTPATTPPEVPRGVWAVPLVALAGYWLLLGALGVRTVRRGLREAAAGEFAAASERLRRFQDREVLFRLVGMPGFVFRVARLAEGATYWMHGMTSEAFSITAEEARGRSPLARSSAAIAAACAAELGDPRAWDRLDAWLARAERAPAKPPEHASILGSRGVADVNALRLGDAARRAEAMLAADPASRPGHLLRASVRFTIGDDDGADADLDRAREAAAREAANPLAPLAVDVLRAEAKRARGDLAAAEAISAPLASSWHRWARLSAAAHSRDLRAARAGLLEVAERFSFDPHLRVAAALALARVERGLGDPASAKGRLAPALASPHASVRQEALAEEAACHEALGDAAAARAARDACAALSRETRVGRAAAARLAVTEGSRSA